MQIAAAVRALARAGRYPLVVLLLDAVATAGALAAAVQLRFEGDVPGPYARMAWILLPALVAVRLACNVAARLHRCCFLFVGLPEALRIGAAAAAGTVLFGLASKAYLPPGLPRTVYALEFFLSATAFGAIRFAPRVVERWRHQAARRRAGAPRAVIVGVGGAAELLARDLVRSPDAVYELVGFVSEDPRDVGLHVQGRPVLGVVDALPHLVRRHAVDAVLLADPRQPAARTRRILEACASCHARFKIVPASIAYVDQRLSAAMLDDVSPEDLLPRDSVRFDEGELRALVAGRRALVTGAGGSIGAEIARQLARHGARQLVLVDLNENELYLGARRLQQAFPDVDVRPEVADVRDAARVLRLGALHRPQDVFHAAAHKHVPLLEDAVDEAVKNNVFGTLNVARMASEAGAERLVFISTDKAVNPTSVMGATKRVGELVVRAIAQGSRTRMTCVRFGNVLGSAGSVVPLFRQQIAHGGPVTVTHPECTRYFMTIPEAVGLVLLAGLGGHGELCVLDMGEPIRITDLARSMITLSGHVPGEEIPIVFTGLRPGEKLFEELLTEDEERSEIARNRIRVTHSPPPPADLVARLARLRRLAEAGDVDALRDELRALVPTFRDGRAAARAPRRDEDLGVSA